MASDNVVLRFVQWLEGFINGGSAVIKFLTTPFDITITNMGVVGFVLSEVIGTITPLELLTVGGLTAFIGIAVVKWFTI